MADAHVTDVTLHVDEILEKETRAQLERDLRSLDGVSAVRLSARAPHLITVIYDPLHVTSRQILEVALRDRLHAELIG